MRRILAALLLIAASASALALDHSHKAWDELLKKHVKYVQNGNASRVDYAGFARERSQLKAVLDEYQKVARAEFDAWPKPQQQAFLINAYNAFTIQWILQNYPTESVWGTSAPFTTARHRLGGELVSLDETESQLRAMGDPRIHAALVCAARSCPPLRREAYMPDRLDGQLDDNVRQWLADPSLNKFDLSNGQAEVSPIFKWYRKDFDAYPGELEGFLKNYAADQVSQQLADKRLEIGFRDYDWGLNDQSDLGKRYSRVQFAIDWIRNWFRSLSHR